MRNCKAGETDWKGFQREGGSVPKLRNSARTERNMVTIGRGEYLMRSSCRLLAMRIFGAVFFLASVIALGGPQTVQGGSASNGPGHVADLRGGEPPQFMRFTD